MGKRDTHVLAAEGLSTESPDLMSAVLTTRMNFAVPHLYSAARFSRRLKDLEEMYKGCELGPFWDEMLAEATAAVLITAASVESYANEVFADRERNFANVSPDLLDYLWKKYERSSTIEKFNLALALLGKPTFARRTEPRVALELLIGLRNALVHFKPEWQNEQVKHKELADSLDGQFSPSPFISSERIFPRRWASYSCTRWALHTAINFLERFEEVSGLSPTIPIERVRDRLAVTFPERGFLSSDQPEGCPKPQIVTQKAERETRFLSKQIYWTRWAAIAAAGTTLIVVAGWLITALLKS